jgi:hypothetical protein
MKLNKKNFCTIINALIVTAGFSTSANITTTLLDADNACLLMLKKEQGSIEAFLRGLDCMSISYEVEHLNDANTFAYVYLNH